MDFLRQEAVKTRIPEIVTMVDASFRLLLTSYYCILRYEMTKLSGTDDWCSRQAREDAISA